MIAIIDYQLSNLFSVKHALDSLGADSIITSDPKVVINAQAAILPGVGAFGDAMKNLKKLHLDQAILKFVNQGKPLMGVCLGMQLLFSESEEFGRHQGLDLIKGGVKKFPTKKVPQIAWNQIYYQPASRLNWQTSPLKKLKNNQYMYFVHSYYVLPQDSRIICSLTEYSGFEYCSSVIKNNLFAVQFHPEKSGPAGIEIYRQWLYNQIHG